MTAHRHTCDAQGWILFDLLIGAVVLTAGLLATTLVFNQSQQSTTRVGEHAAAVALATSLLSQATAYGCGAETGTSVPGTSASDGSSYPDTATLWSQCAGLYAGDPDAPFPGALGDPVTHPVGTGNQVAAWQVSSSGTRFSVNYRATWVGTTGSCPAATTGTPAPLPIGQTRTVTVGWSDHGAALTFAATSFGGVPVDAAVYSSPDAAGIVVTGMAAGSMARLTVPVSLFAAGTSGSVSIDRAASAAGCAWFPFLLPAGPGTYSVQYYANGDADGAPSAMSPQNLVVVADTLTTWTP